MKAIIAAVLKAVLAALFAAGAVCVHFMGTAGLIMLFNSYYPSWLRKLFWESYRPDTAVQFDQYNGLLMTSFILGCLWIIVAEFWMDYSPHKKLTTAAVTALTLGSAWKTYAIVAAAALQVASS